MVPAIHQTFSEVVVKNGGSEKITNFLELANRFFDDMVDAGVVVQEEHGFAGSYYRLSQGNYNAFRVKYSKSSEIFSAAERVGARYFPDMFEGYIRQQTVDDLEDALRGTIIAPASDRIVLRTDNLLPVVQDIEDLKLALIGCNDPDGLLSDRKERLVSELSAGQELLKAPSFRLKAVLAVLVSTLGFIASEFAGGIIGDLAVKLLEQIKPILGL